jgi:hypothetical protein
MQKFLAYLKQARFQQLPAKTGIYYIFLINALQPFNDGIVIDIVRRQYFKWHVIPLQCENNRFVRVKTPRILSDYTRGRPLFFFQEKILRFRRKNIAFIHMYSFPAQNLDISLCPDRIRGDQANVFQLPCD